MKLVKCDKGHFYDGDKYQTCPHCANGAGEDSPTIAVGNNVADVVTVPLEEKTAPKSQSMSIQDAVELVNTTDGNALPDDEKTVRMPAFSKEGKNEPVVGWLVGLNNDMYGKSMPLVAGKNFIGRDRSMDVVIEGDNTVSRQKHAIVIFEPRAKMFLVQPGESRELFYLNEQVVLDNQSIKKGDVICVGNTKLMFVPLVDDTFNWDNEN